VHSFPLRTCGVEVVGEQGRLLVGGVAGALENRIGHAAVRLGGRKLATKGTCVPDTASTIAASNASLPGSSQ
jgi:hypothetical protein